jgi:1-acyl-sn-glycerol-3-phosphate acyltransferase
VEDLCYRFLRSIARFIFKLFTDWEVVGLENVPPDSPFISVSNHTHWLDPPLHLASLPRRIYPLVANKWWRRPVIGQLMASIGSIPVLRGEVDRRALRRAIETLKQGKVLGIAPEGTRSDTGALQRGRSGAAYIASSMGVKVVIGEPFTLPPLPRKAGAKSERLAEYTTQIMYRIAELFPEEYRGLYR